MARGQAEPPITTFFRCGSLRSFCSRYCSSMSQTVGTAAVKVTFSVSSSSKIAAPSMRPPGITSLAPIIGADCASPHALAWNIGTTGKIVSRLEMPIASGCTAIIACSTLERWL